MEVELLLRCPRDSFRRSTIARLLSRPMRWKTFLPMGVHAEHGKVILRTREAWRAPSALWALPARRLHTPPSIAGPWPLAVPAAAQTFSHEVVDNAISTTCHLFSPSAMGAPDIPGDDLGCARTLASVEHNDYG